MRPYYFDFECYRSRGPYRRHDEYTSRQAVTELLQAGIALARRWLKRVRDRRELASLDYRLRRDIGVSASNVASECAKPFLASMTPVNLR